MPVPLLLLAPAVAAAATSTAEIIVAFFAGSAIAAGTGYGGYKWWQWKSKDRDAEREKSAKRQSDMVFATLTGIGRKFTDLGDKIAETVGVAKDALEDINSSKEEMFISIDELINLNDDLNKAYGFSIEYIQRLKSHLSAIKDENNQLKKASLQIEGLLHTVQQAYDAQLLALEKTINDLNKAYGLLVEKDEEIARLKDEAELLKENNVQKEEVIVEQRATISQQREEIEGQKVEIKALNDENVKLMTHCKTLMAHCRFFKENQSESRPNPAESVDSLGFQ